MKKIKKAIAIVGPTASGKTKLAVDLAVKLNGEILSADSRQVYNGMDIGTGKDLDEYIIEVNGSDGKKSKVAIPYHLIDIISPNTKFDLAGWHKKAVIAMQDVSKRNKLPIVAGGTGLYAQALVEGYDLCAVTPNKELRKKYEKKSVAELFEIINKKNSAFAARLNESEIKNKRRLIRYAEIADYDPGQLSGDNKKSLNDYNWLVLGIASEPEILRKRIGDRLRERLEKEDMVGEVERLHDAQELSWERLVSFGLEYKFISYYLMDKLSYDEMFEKLEKASWHFARRQMSWYRRWEKQGRIIYWVENEQEALKYIEPFLAS